MSWTDKNHNRWLFGGFGFEVTHPNPDNVPGFLNDMWVWPTSPNTGSDDGWWLPGGGIPANLPTLCGFSGGFADISPLQLKNRGAIYGKPGDPGGPWGAITWTDPTTGNLWMFGGQGNSRR